MNTTSPFWNLLDGICVINLDHRTDRWQEISEQLTHVPTDKIHRISAVWGKKLESYGKGRYFQGCNEEESLFWAGRAGCLLSHRRCIEHASQNQWERVLILEDDADFHDSLTGDIGQMLAQTITAEKWDILYLGATPYYPMAAPLNKVSSAKGEVTLARIMGPLCTHAMLIHKQAYRELLNLLPTEDTVWQWLATHLSYDSWLANEYGRTARHTILGCYPNLCSQSLSYSDIEHHQIQHGQGALGNGSYPVTYVNSATFAAQFRNPSFILKKWMKLAAHAALGVYYRFCGYRKFSVSIESAGYIGALKAALQVLRQRQ